MNHMKPYKELCPGEWISENFIMKGIGRDGYLSISSSNRLACSFFLVIWNYWSSRQCKTLEVGQFFLFTPDQGLIPISTFPPSKAAMKWYIAKNKNKNRTSTYNTPSCYHPRSNYFQFRLLPETDMILCIWYSSVDSSSRYLISIPLSLSKLSTRKEDSSLWDLWSFISQWTWLYLRFNCLHQQFWWQMHVECFDESLI